MRQFLISILLLGFYTTGMQAEIVPTHLRCEYLENPLAIDVLHPRLSWVNVAPKGERGQYSTGWEIRVSTTKEKLLKNEADLWASGKQQNAVVPYVVYGGRPLESMQDCWWQVRVWDVKGKVSEWSEPAFWSMGILKPEEWKSQWIGAPWQGEESTPRPVNHTPGQPLKESEMPPPAPMLRKSFTIQKQIASARAFVSGLGYFELYLNGKKVDDDVLSPNLTLYGKRPGLENNYISVEDQFKEYRVMYLTYDVKKLLHQGLNAVGTILGNGFYNAPVNWTQSYGSPRFIGQIVIQYTDGTVQIIGSDSSWKASKSPIVMDLVYDGEHYDARDEQEGWSSPEFDDSKWEQVVLRNAPGGMMKAQMSPPDRVNEVLKPLKIDRLGDGHYKIDFGQEISGWLHIQNFSGEKGRKIDIKYICESPVGANSYTCSGKGNESYSARFTWFVFREVELFNWPGDLNASQIQAEAVYAAVETTGKFECSNPLFNTIDKIWWRSQTDNMHGGIASDCPHRERSPYTGDGQVSCVTVMHHFDARSFYTKWIQDMLGAQNPVTGYVPNGAPWQPGCGGGVAWGAAINIMPWEFYLHYGDIDMLQRNYEGMKGYVRYMLTWTDEEGIMFSQAPDKNKPNEWLNLGDWVAPGKLPPTDMVHTFFLWRCADLTAKTAKALQKSNDEKLYSELAERTRLAFQHKFFDRETGSYGPCGGNIFALKMGVPTAQKEKVIAALKKDIENNGKHLDTGIFGTQFFFEVLADNGLQELACEVMNQRTAPGYGWWIEQGATTTWEQWNGENSRNHPMFGGGLTWLYRKLAGMNADEEVPGYRHIIFKPQPVKDISHASFSNLTPYGKASVSWKKESKSFQMNLEVPVDCRATVYIPASSPDRISESGKSIKQSRDIKYLRTEDGYVIYKIPSGNYTFEVR